MEELRLSLFALGALAIGGILIHGLWTSRKNSDASSTRNEFLPHDEPQEEGDYIEPELAEDWSVDGIEDVEDVSIGEPAEYDELGIGQVRVVSQTPVSPAEPSIPPDDKVASTAPDMGNIEPVIAAERTEPSVSDLPADATNVLAQAQENVKTSAQEVGDTPPSLDIPEPPPSLLKKAPLDSPISPSKVPEVNQEATSPSKSVKSEKAEKLSLAEQAKNLMGVKKTANRRRKEPKVDEEQMSIDFGPDGAGNDRSGETPAKAKSANPAPKAEKVDASAPTQDDAAHQEVLVINLKAKEGNDMAGSALLPMLLTLGLKFGDQDVFHRHVNPNGTGPVLFSLANMFKPGTFDIDNIETFKTQGLSLFMIMPTQTDPQQVFQMMHNAARKLAEEFGLSMLDGRRSTLTKQSVQQYVEKIREFERKRMLQR